MTQPPHPDELQAQQATKAIKTGGTQAADTASMEAYWQAIEEGKSKDEANKVFSDTYNKSLCTSKKISAVS